MTSNEHVICTTCYKKKYNIQDYITNQITHFNLQVGHASIDMTQY